MTDSKPTVCAVSYLNTSPLVWGLLHGRQRGAFNLIFRLPSVCASMLAGGEADIGLVPAIELARQQLTMVHGVGIASRGEVRSILLIHKRPLGEIERLAADTSSRTSVALAQLILERRYGAVPELVPHAPDVAAMLAVADAAVIIGDPALRVDPRALPFPVLDLGREWHDLTGLPMVFAVWAGRAGAVDEHAGHILRESCRFGIDHIEDIVSAEAAPRGLSPDLARHYLTRHIVHEFGTAEYEGLNLFLQLAGQLPRPALLS